MPPFSRPRTFLRAAAAFWLFSAIVGTLYKSGTHVHPSLLDWTDPLRSAEHVLLAPLYLALSFASDRVVRWAVVFFACFGTLVTVGINVVSPFLLDKQVVFHPEHELGHVVIASWAWYVVITTMQRRRQLANVTA